MRLPPIRFNSTACIYPGNLTRPPLHWPKIIILSNLAIVHEQFECHAYQQCHLQSHTIKRHNYPTCNATLALNGYIPTLGSHRAEPVAELIPLRSPPILPQVCGEALAGDTIRVWDAQVIGWVLHLRFTAIHTHTCIRTYINHRDPVCRHTDIHVYIKR